VDFSIIYQLRTKKFWWLDVMFYFVISLLIATVFCYLIFAVKISMQNNQIRDLKAAIETVGTEQQLAYEKEVVTYQKKINDFAAVFQNHGFSSNVFVFMEKQTRPNVWFQSFSMDQKGAKVNLSGEADDMDAFSRQVAVFERNEYIDNINLLNSNLGESDMVGFNLNLTLNPKIFGYISDTLAELTPLATTTPSSAPLFQPGSGKLITLFSFPLTPEVVGAIDQTNYTVTLSVPFGTDITSGE